MSKLQNQPLILPCIDLMDGKVVQLVQGKEKALEGDAPEVMLQRFAGFPEIQVIDLDAALGKGSNDEIVRKLCGLARCRVGGGVRNAERAEALAEQGAHRIIVGTSAFRRRWCEPCGCFRRLWLPWAARRS